MIKKVAKNTACQIDRHFLKAAKRKHGLEVLFVLQNKHKLLEYPNSHRLFLFRTVSYTHLDVYKRQQLLRSMYQMRGLAHTSKNPAASLQN